MSPEEATPEAPKLCREDPPQEIGAAGLEIRTGPLANEPAMPATGRRPALGNLRRELLDTESAHPGVQKLLLDRLDRAESECGDLRAYVEKFHEADKTAAVLKAQLKTGTAFELLCGGGFGCGGILIGISPSLFDTHLVAAIVILVVGVIFIVTSTTARIVQVRK